MQNTPLGFTLLLFKVSTLRGIVRIFGAFIMMLTETFFNNALPTIINQYSVSQSIAQWVSTGYQLVTGLMIPLSAWFFHRFNTKHTFISLLLIFYWVQFVAS